MLLGALLLLAAADSNLAAEIVRMAEEDQAARSALKGDEVHPWGRVEEVDRKNTDRMKQIVAQRGWPGKRMVGEHAAHMAWLLVQHADRDLAFQKHCLALLQRAVENRDASAVDLAYLTDRVRVAEGKPQAYGTQFVTKNGKSEPRPIEDEAHVDERRKALGLEPMAEYRKQIEALTR